MRAPDMSSLSSVPGKVRSTAVAKSYLHVPIRAVGINFPIQLFLIVPGWELHQASPILPAIAYPTVTLLFFYTDAFHGRDLVPGISWIRAVDSIRTVKL